MPRLLCVGPELHQDRADVIEALNRQMRGADARQLLRHDDLFVEVAPIPPYCLGQCGAIQPLRESV